MLHVPYKGAGPAITALLSGEIDLMFATMVSILPQVKSGKVRALGVTGARRSAAMPQLATISESGLAGYEANAGFATYTPVGTPDALVQSLHNDMSRIINSSDVRERLAAQVAKAMASTPQELARYASDEIVRWARVIKQSSARAE